MTAQRRESRLKNNGLTGAILISFFLHAAVGAAVIFSYLPDLMATAGVEAVEVEIIAEPAINLPEPAPPDTQALAQAEQGGSEGAVVGELDEVFTSTPVALNVGEADTLYGDAGAQAEGSPEAIDAPATEDEASEESAAAAPAPVEGVEEADGTEDAVSEIAEQPNDLTAPESTEDKLVAEQGEEAQASSAVQEGDLNPEARSGDEAVANEQQGQVDGRQQNASDEVQSANQTGELEESVEAGPRDGRTEDATQSLEAPGSDLDVQPTDPAKELSDTALASLQTDDVQPSEANEAQSGEEAARQPKPEGEVKPLLADEPLIGPRLLVPAPNPQRKIDTAGAAKTERGTAESAVSLSEALRFALSGGALNADALGARGREQSSKVAYTEAVRSAIAPRFWSAMSGVRGSGTAVVEVKIWRDGSVGGAKIVASSGVPAIDAAALSAARIADYPPLPGSVKGESLKVHIPLRVR